MVPLNYDLAGSSFLVATPLPLKENPKEKSKSILGFPLKNDEPPTRPLPNPSRETQCNLIQVMLKPADEWNTRTKGYELPRKTQPSPPMGLQHDQKALLMGLNKGKTLPSPAAPRNSNPILRSCYGCFAEFVSWSGHTGSGPPIFHFSTPTKRKLRP